MDLFVLQCHSGREDFLRQKLLIALGDSESIIIPRRIMTNRKMGKPVTKQYILFPGYVFVEREYIDESWLSAVRSISEAIKFLPDNNNIRPLSSMERDLFRRITLHGENIGDSAVHFDENNRIAVVRGPLEGMEGQIIKVDRRKGRAKVSFDMYDKVFEVDFGFYDIEKRDALRAPSGTSAAASTQEMKEP